MTQSSVDDEGGWLSGFSVSDQRVLPDCELVGVQQGDKGTMLGVVTGAEDDSLGLLEDSCCIGLNQCTHVPGLF